MLKFSFFYTFTVILLLCSCSSNQTKKSSEGPKQEETKSDVPDMHSSKIALDWNGVYTGVLPCADCEGIETRIVIKQDGTFERSMTYLGKESAAMHEEGKFKWDESGSRILLSSDKGDQLYQVGENVLFHLDEEGNRVSGELAANYRLIKNRVDFNLEDKKWVLIELRGQEIKVSEEQKQGFIEFNMETGRIHGNNTCNNFFGQYELKPGNQIYISKVGSTRMACPNMESQDEFNRVLEMADNYNVSDGILSLNKVRMAPLARFKLDE